jgi:hypothetical protein
MVSWYNRQLGIEAHKPITIKSGHSLVLAPRITSPIVSPEPTSSSSTTTTTTTTTTTALTSLESKVSRHAIFYHVGSGDDERSIEWYPRGDGSDYGCEYGTIVPSTSLPSDPALALPTSSTIETLRNGLAALSSSRWQSPAITAVIGQSVTVSTSLPLSTPQICYYAQH